MSADPGAAAGALDIREKGAQRDGQPQTLDRRLFAQLLAFGGSKNSEILAKALEASGLEAVLYEDANDPEGVAVLTLSEEPDLFLTRVRELLRHDPFRALSLKAEFTMLGRTYSIGYESDLEDWLLRKPRRTVMNADWPWAIWYPLRRSGSFFQLPPEQQSKIMGEHAAIGRAFGQKDFSHDVRLACFGLDRRDNDFVIGLVGKELYPLSATVQAMRRTQQTSLYIEKMGPFFVGKAVWRGGSK